MSRRMRRCSSPSAKRIERGPATGRSGPGLAPRCATDGIGGVHGAHGVGMPDEHERRVVEGEADGERLAVGGRAAAQERRRPHDPLQGLQRGRLARPGRQSDVHRRPR